MTPDVNISKDKYNIKLRIPGTDMIDLDIGCNSSEQYVKWMAACRLAAKGKTMADPTYDVEISGVRTFLSLQNDGGTGKDENDGGDQVSFVSRICIVLCAFVFFFPESVLWFLCVSC